MIEKFDEGEKIYYSIFKKKIPLLIKEHFDRVSEKINLNYSEEELHEYYRYLKRVSDLEALELASRYFKRLKLLNKKFQVMIFLAETVPENYEFYINSKNNIFYAFFATVCYGFYTFYKMMKGIILLLVC